MKKVLPLAVLASLSLATAPASAGVDLPPLTHHFCPRSVEDAGAAIGELTTDLTAGVTWSSSIFSTTDGGLVCFYIENLGPGDFVFQRPSWSVRGLALTSGPIPLTPSSSSANFSDNGFSGTFAEGTRMLAHIGFAAVELSRGKQGNAQLDLTFYRPANDTYQTVRVTVHFADNSP